MKNKFYKIGLGIVGLLPGLVLASSVCVPRFGPFITCNGPECTFDDFMCGFQLFTAFLIKLGFAVVVVAIVSAGFQYMTSGGDTNKIKKANSIFRKTVVGILIILCAYLLVKLLLTTLGYDFALFPVKLQ